MTKLEQARFETNYSLTSANRFDVRCKLCGEADGHLAECGTYLLIEEREITDAKIDDLEREITHRKGAIDAALAYLKREEQDCRCGAPKDRLAVSMHSWGCSLAAAMRALDQDFKQEARR